MKKIYHPYWEWEDFKAGMWRKVNPKDELSMFGEAKEFTGDHFKYGKAMLRVIREWPITCDNNLSNLSINRKAFIGHAAVCLQLGIPEYITRMAWGHLTITQQYLANAEAERAIKAWFKSKHESKNIELY